MDMLTSIVAIALVTSATPGPSPSCEIVSYGILQADEELYSQPAPGTATGYIRTFGPIKIKDKTDKIPARIGISFGVEHLFSLVPNDGQLEMIITHPPMVMPKGVTTISRAPKNPTSEGTSYSFDYPSELLPGEWTFSFRYRGNLLCQKTFSIIAE